MAKLRSGSRWRGRSRTARAGSTGRSGSCRSARLRDGDLSGRRGLGDPDAVDKLLDLGLPIDAVDAQGADALLRAAGCGHATLVRRLLERGANPDHAAPSGATPLSAAVTARRDSVVAAMLDRTVDRSTRRLPDRRHGADDRRGAGLPGNRRPPACARRAGERAGRARHAARCMPPRNSHSAARETARARRMLELLIEHGAD